MTVSGKMGLLVILLAGGLGFIIALAGSPGIAPPEGKVVYVSVVAINADNSE